MDQAARRTAYACNVTYCTAKELVFDYLRDRIVRRHTASDLHERVRGLDEAVERPSALLLRGLCMYGPDWFDVANHPQMNFRSTSIVEAPSGYTMTGDLTIKGITQSVSFRTTYNGSSTFPMDKSTHYGFEASGLISRSAFGISYGLPLLGDEVNLTLDAQFVLPPAET